MYKYSEKDIKILKKRTSEFKYQVERRLNGDLTEDEFKPLRLMNGLYLQLHAYMLRVAIPYGELSHLQLKKLAEELEVNIFNADWITIGIMAPSDTKAIEALQSISNKYSSIKFGNLDSLHADGSVFLKGNQKTGNVFVRSENGLGEGILITCQFDEDAEESNTFGPLPLDFFCI